MPFGCALDSAGQRYGDALIEIGDSPEVPPDVPELEDVSPDVEDAGDRFVVETSDADSDDVYMPDEGDGGETDRCTGNRPPNHFYQLSSSSSPGPGVVGVSTQNVTFEWVAAGDPNPAGPDPLDPDPRGSVTYTFTLTADHDGDPATPPVLVFERAGLTEATFSLSDAGIRLEFGITHYWSVTAIDGCGADTPATSSPWSFTTKAYPICSKIGSDVLVPDPSSVYSVTPSIVWNGSEYRAYWLDARDGNYEIYSKGLTEDGTPIGSDVRVTNDDSYSKWPSAVWTGSEYGVVWLDHRYGGIYGVYFKRMSGTGVPIEPDIRIADSNGSSDWRPSFVLADGEFGLSWYDNRIVGNYEIYFARLSTDGTKMGDDVPITNASGDSLNPSLAWTGSEFGVVWQDNRGIGNNKIYFAHLLADGTKIGSDILIRDVDAINDSEYPSIVWTGTEYGVVWQDDRVIGNKEIYFARLSTDGTKMGDDVRITDAAGDSVYPFLAWTGSEFGVSWNDHRDGNDEIYFAHISRDGAKTGPDIRITDNVEVSKVSSLAWTGSEYGALWLNGQGGDYEIYFARIGCEL